MASTLRISACVSGLAARQQPLLHHFGRLDQQLPEQARRNVGAQADLLRQHAVIAGAPDQRGEGAVGQPRLMIGGDAARDLAVAARDQNVRQRLVDAETRRKREQMRLALGLGNVHEIGIVESAPA